MHRRRPTRKLSPRSLRRLLNFYPPWWFQRIRVASIRDDFLACRVRVRRSWRTRNLMGSTFGGTIYAAGDPVIAVLFWQILARRGVPVEAWLRTATIRFRRPAWSTLTLDFVIERIDVEDAIGHLDREGRWSRWYRVDALDADGRVCAEIETEVYLRRAGAPERSGS